MREVLRAAAGACAFLFLSLLGCANQQQELIEAELRRKESEIEELKGRLGAKDGEVQALEIELEMCQRKRLREAKGKCPPPLGTVQIVEKITLGRATGGYRQSDSAEADDSLLVMLEPRDADDSAIKAPGSVKIDVYEVSTAGLKTFLSSWEIAPRELRRLWDSPLIGGAGYRIVLPWKAYPTTERIKIIVHFTSLDGQQFEAEKETTVRLLDLTKRKRPICPPESDAPPAPPVYSPPPPIAPDLIERPSLERPAQPMKRSDQPISAPPGGARRGGGTAPPASGRPDEELPMPQPLRLPTADPPLSFEMRPFRQDGEPIIQVGHRATNSRAEAALAPRLGPPEGAKPR